MNCGLAREAISALLDGESSPLEPAQLEAHLAGCAACRSWRERAHAVTRRARLAAAAPAPLPDSALLSAMQASDRRRSWWRSLAAVRVALVLVALAQLAFSLPDLLSGSYRGAPIHVAHEMGALDMALAVGLLVAAWRPVRAQGMRALVGCAALLLALTALIDLLDGRTSLSDEAPHLLVVAGWLLLRRGATLAPLDAGDRGLPRSARVRLSLRPSARWPATDSRATLSREPDGGERGGSDRRTVVPPAAEHARARTARGG
jgi:predicted anti-sigma-YlaC factor YlaD